MIINTTSRVSLLQRLDSPTCFPSSYHDEEDVISFHKLERQLFYSGLFLGESQLLKSCVSLGALTLGDILLGQQQAASTNVAVHYIFHLAYCCSTLLSRYFQEVEAHLVLKEPSLLSQFAVTSSFEQTTDPTRLEVILGLLSRVYSSQDLAIIKPNVPVNIMAGDILAVQRSATASFLVHGLEACVISVMKEKWRLDRVRSWNRNLFRNCVRRKMFSVRPDALCDVHTVAYWWIENLRLAIELRDRFPERVTLLSADEIAQSPREALEHIQTLPGMGMLIDRIPRMLSGSVSKTYSKRSEVAYDLSSRSEEIRALTQRFERQLLQARDWLGCNYEYMLTAAEMAAISSNV